MNWFQKLRYRFDMRRKDRLDAALLRISLRYEPAIEFTFEEYEQPPHLETPLLWGSEVLEGLPRRKPTKPYVRGGLRFDKRPKVPKRVKRQKDKLKELETEAEKHDSVPVLLGK